MNVPAQPLFLAVRAPAAPGTCPPRGHRLADPSAAPDAKVLAARGGAAVAPGALLTPLAAMLPFIELGLGADSSCRQLIGEAWRNVAR